MIETRNSFQTSDELYLVSPAHPNYRRWSETERTAIVRGELVVRLMARIVSVDRQRVLDIGCGDGGASLAFARRGCNVVATDADPRRINSARELFAQHADATALIETRIVAGEKLPFENRSFDIVVLQGVLEHTVHPEQVLAEIARVLTGGGAVFMTVPNRWSIYNCLSDPHWGLPIVGTLNRRGVSFVLNRLLGRDEHRPDLAQLLSLRRLYRLFSQSGLAAVFLNKEAAEEMFERPESVLWTRLERSAVRLMAALRLRRIVIRAASNQWGIRNFLLTPTWYLAGTKRASE